MIERDVHRETLCLQAATKSSSEPLFVIDHENPHRRIPRTRFMRIRT
jgi:hypothetical protein